MKKMMVAAFAVAFAAVAQAASVSWQSGIPTELAGYDFGDEALTMVVFENNSAYDMGTIWSDYQGGTLAGTNVGTAIDDFDAYINDFMEVTGGTGWSDGSTVYAAVILTHTDAAGEVDYYMVNTATAMATDAGNIVADLGNTIGGGAAALGDTTWVSAENIPEPTSGLLLLIGMAGLALKRKHA